MKRLNIWLVLLLAIQPVAADFSVIKSEARLASGGLNIQTEIDWTISDKVEEAINHGVELYLVAEFRVNRRKWGRDQRLASRKLRASVRHHSLSGRYLLKRSDRTVKDSFLTLTEALDSLKQVGFSDIEYVVSSSGSDYLAVRARISNKALPGPLQPLAYMSPAWRLSSGWTEWEIVR